MSAENAPQTSLSEAKEPLELPSFKIIAQLQRADYFYSPRVKVVLVGAFPNPLAAVRLHESQKSLTFFRKEGVRCGVPIAYK